MSIMGNFVGSYSQMGKTFIIEDESGNELTGVITNVEQVFDATDNDVRKDLVYAGDAGVSVGQKIIPTYYTCQGCKLVSAGSALTIANLLPDIDSYDYTKLQALVCAFNTSVAKSVSTEKVLIDSKVYDVQSTTAVSSVVKNHETKIIELGITTDSRIILRYFMYKEIK